MSLTKFVQRSINHVDFFYEGQKIGSVVNASVILHPCAVIMNSWPPEKCTQLADEMAPFVADQMKYKG